MVFSETFWKVIIMKAGFYGFLENGYHLKLHYNADEIMKHKKQTHFSKQQLNNRMFKSTKLIGQVQ